MDKKSAVAQAIISHIQQKTSSYELINIINSIYEPNTKPGQSLTFTEAAKWIEKHGTVAGLEVWVPKSNSRQKLSDSSNVGIYVGRTCRIPPVRVNDPQDPSTWVKGVYFFGKLDTTSKWVLEIFSEYIPHIDSEYPFQTGNYCYRYGKLATPEQVAAWNLINEL